MFHWSLLEEYKVNSLIDTDREGVNLEKSQYEPKQLYKINSIKKSQ